MRAAHEPHSDEDLAGRAADGDLAAFEALVVRHGASVIAALERLLGDHHLALDAAQEVWIKVHRALPRYRRGERLRPWLFAIALNHGRDALRRRARRVDGPGAAPAIDGAPLLAPDDADPSGRVLERAAIASVLAAMDERFREPLLLVDGLGLGYEEAALALGVPLGTAKSRVHRGRLAFRELWAEREARDTSSGRDLERSRR